MAIITTLHFLSFCSLTILAQEKDRRGPPCPLVPDCMLLLSHLDPQVSKHPSACLWLLTGSDKGSGVGDAPGHGRPLTLSPGGGSLSSLAESETVRWRQSRKVTWGRNTDPRLSSEQR